MLDDLSCVVQQAQGLVLSTGRDLAALRAQLRVQEGETTASSDVVNLQADVQQKQEATVHLLSNGLDLFLKKKGELDWKASTLGNVFAKDKELNTIKKTMQRYFNGQDKLRMTEEEGYQSLLQIHKMNQSHLMDAAADLYTARLNERMQHQVLANWMKKWMQRTQFREQQAHLEVLKSTCDDFARRFFSVTSKANLKQKVWRTWLRYACRRKQKCLLGDINSLEQKVEYLRQKCAEAESLVHSLQRNECAQKQHSEQVYSHAREILEDEIDRLKGLLEEMADEFSERTRTYVRQQEESEHFFRLREQNLKHELEIARSDAEFSMRRAEQLYKGMQSDRMRIEEYMAVTHTLFLEHVSRKGDHYASAFSNAYGELFSQYANSRKEVSRLLEDVALLHPLSERVVCLESETSKLLKLLNASREENERLQGDAQRLCCVCTLCTAHIRRLRDYDRVAACFQRWALVTACNRRCLLQEDHTQLEAALTEQRRELTLQNLKKVEQLQDDLVASQLLQRQLLDEIGLLHKQCEKTDSQRRKVEMELSSVSTQRLREQQEVQSLLYELGTTQVNCMLLEEAKKRALIEKLESVCQGELYRKNACAWKDQLDFQHKKMVQITTAYEALQQDHEIQAVLHREQNKTHYVMLSELVQDMGIQKLTSRVFWMWRSYTFRRSVEHREVAHRMAQQSYLEDLARQTMLKMQQLQKESRDEMMQLHTEHLQCLELIITIQEEMALQGEAHNAKLVLVNAEHSKTKQAHAALEREHKVCKNQLEGAGELLVEYCAAAAFTRWRAWACELRNQRLRQQYEGLFLATSQWQDSFLHEVLFSSQKWREFLFDSVASMLAEFRSHSQSSYCQLLDRFNSLSSLNEEMKVCLQKLECEKHQLEMQLCSEEVRSRELKEETIEIKKAHERRVVEELNMNQFIADGYHLVNTHLEEAVAIFLAFSSAHLSAPSRAVRGGMENVVQRHSEYPLQATCIDAVDSNPQGVASQFDLTKDTGEGARPLVRTPDVIQECGGRFAETKELFHVIEVDEVPESGVDPEEIYTGLRQNGEDAMEGQTSASLGKAFVKRSKNELVHRATTPIHKDHFDGDKCRESYQSVEQGCEADSYIHCELDRLNEDSLQEPIVVLQNAVSSLVLLLSRFDGLVSTTSFHPDSRPIAAATMLHRLDNLSNSAWAPIHDPSLRQPFSLEDIPDSKGDHRSDDRIAAEKVALVANIHQTERLLGHNKIKPSDVTGTTTERGLDEAQAEAQGDKVTALIAAVSTGNENLRQEQGNIEKLPLCPQSVAFPLFRCHFKTENVDLQKGLSTSKGASKIEEDTLKQQLETITSQILEVGEQMQRMLLANKGELKAQTALMQAEIQQVRQSSAVETKRALSTLEEALEVRSQIQLMSLQGRIKQLELEKDYLESRGTQLEEGTADLLREVRHDMAKLTTQYQSSIEGLAMSYQSHREGLKGEVYLASRLTTYSLQVCLHCFFLSHTYVEDHSAKVDWLVESLSRVYREGPQSQSSALSVPHSADSDTQLSLLLCAVREYWEVSSELCEESLRKKCLLFEDVAVSLVQECWEKCGLLLEQNSQASLLNMEAIETENMQLHEKLAYLEAQAQSFSREQAVDDVLVRSDETCAQDKEAGWNNGLQRGEVLSRGAVTPPSQGILMSETAQPRPVRCEEDCSSGELHPYDLSNQEKDSPSTLNGPSSGDAEVAPARGSMTSSCHDNSFLHSAPHMRELSLDSLELSLDILRYSDMLSKQTSRNEERLGHADLLSAELEDLAAQGHRVWCLARQGNLVPESRERRGRKAQFPK